MALISFVYLDLGQILKRADGEPSDWVSSWSVLPAMMPKRPPTRQTTWRKPYKTPAPSH